ncbi:DUF485 domain-containing protein [Nonomuraea sp. NPDC049480]|uniref:DUF485 domain-containing protein n=1 Tax=Nonomuraea sp. NPDC049480 TaxID=3364353 RepID=UPI0037927A97
MSTLPWDDVITVAPDDAEKYLALQRSAAFARLRSRSRRYLVSMTALFLGMFAITVALAGWMPESLAVSVFGHVNLGMLFAVGLIVLPVIITAVHLFYAGRRLDPLAERIREEFERNRR